MRRRRMYLRLAGVLTLAALLAGVVTSAAGALAFADEPCYPSSADWLTCPDAMVDKDYSIKLEAKTGGGAGPPYTYVLISGAPPPGITVRSDGLVSGKPTRAGQWRFWVELRDKGWENGEGCFSGGGNSCAQREFSITVVPRVLVTVGPAPPATVGAPYSLTLTAVMKSGPEATSPPQSPLTWSIDSGSLPPGLALQPTGVITGTPTTEGSYQVVVKAALIDGRNDTQLVKIDVRTAVTIAARTLPRSEVGVPLRLALAASGGTGPGTYTWSLSAGSLPQGVVLAADGTIAGTPRVAGTFPFTATVKDSQERSAAFNGQLVVAERLQVLPGPLRTAKVGRPYRVKLRARGGVAPLRWRIVTGTLPRGARLERALGVLEGAPRKAGRYRVVVEARDALGVVSRRALVIDVRA